MTYRAATLIASVLFAGCSEAAGLGDFAPDHDLVFEGVLEATSELLAWDAQSRSVRRLLPEGTVVMDPQPSPDGSRIAFVVADYVQGTGDIWVMDRDGSNAAQLTFSPELDDQPAWSPDGARIAFRSYQTQLGGDIWTMTATGGSSTNLTPDPLPGITEEDRPAWSPDGARIAFGSNEGGNRDIWTMAVDGSDHVRLTETIDLDTEPAWSPDGTTIAFRRSSSGAGSDIYLVPAGGGSARPLALPGEQRMPVWWPDGRGLVVVSHASISSRPDLYGVRIDGTDFVPLVTDEVPGGSLNPAFFPRP